MYIVVFWRYQTGNSSNSLYFSVAAMNSGFHEKNGKEKINFFSSDSFVQQNTSSLWSINEPFCIHLVQGGRVNADEGMKVGVVLRGFFFSLCCSMKCGIHLFTNISISVVGTAGLTCKWQGVTWSRPHVSHNSSRRLVKTSKQEVGRAYLFFTSHSEA